MEDPTPQLPRSGRAGQLLLLMFLIFIAVPTAANLYVDLRWFRSVDHGDVFTTILSTQFALGISVALAVGLFLFANLRIALKLSAGRQPLFLHDPDGVPRVNLGDVASRLILPGCALVGLMAGTFNYRHWSTWLSATHATDFGQVDPLFGRDIGFYIFVLPLWELAGAIGMWAVGLSAAAAALLYIVRGSIHLLDTRVSFHPGARAHLSVLLALVMVALAFQTYLDIFQLLYSQVGPMTGASYADVNAKLPALRIKMALAGVGALLALAGMNRTNFTFAVVAIVLYVLAGFGANLYPGLVHTYSVVPNELEKETPYLKNNIDATRAAYGLANVDERELTGASELSAADIDNNSGTIDNIRLWDHEELLDTFAQIQEIRTYYDFNSVDNDRYVIDGKLRQTMLSPRELNTRSLPNATWINERFQFTHGYGLTLGPVNEASPEGLPKLFIQDIPPVTEIDGLEVTQPAIYFGELSNDHVFVRTRNREFDYPSAGGNVETDYDGKAGIRFDSTLMRLALATRLGALKLLLTNDIDADSRVLLYRNIQARVSQVAPFLIFDNDPYMVVRADGTLVWICDAYTASQRYPYAENFQNAYVRLNYIRNSVKVIVDAYDGSVTLYAVDDTDPILKTWAKIFPDMFESLASMPEDLRAHLRYPEMIFEVQTEMYTIYHMDQANLLYNREDQWQIPSISVRQTEDRVEKEQMKPYYTVMKLPGEQDVEFIQMLPFTPASKDNLAAWMVARADGDAYGQLVVYKFPKDRLVFGPQQIVNRINQDAEISRQISLWDQRGSRAIFGTLLVIPIEESLIYVRPLYLRSQGGKIPELKRVIVVYEKQIAMEPSLRGAMNAIFGASGTAPLAEGRAAPSPESPAAGDEPAVPTSEAAAAVTGGLPSIRALQHFERAVAAQRRGDWAAYGKELEQVELALRAIQPPGTGPGRAEPEAPEPEAPEAPEPPEPPLPQPDVAGPGPAAAED